MQAAPERAETQAVMGWVIDQCLILLHPIMPFITEELWQLSGDRPKMLIHADWPEYDPASLVDAEADHEMNWVIGLIEAIRSARAQMNVPAALQVPLLVGEIDERGQAAWERNAALIQRLARIDSLSRTDAMPRGTVSIPVEGAGADYLYDVAVAVEFAAANRRAIATALERPGRPMVIS